MASPCSNGIDCARLEVGSSPIAERRRHHEGYYHRSRLGKSVFTVHGVDERGNAVLRKTVRRAKVLEVFAQLPACIVGMEACAGAQHWARELRKLGHDPRIMAAEFVAPYRQGGKNDTNDAAAICEAVSRPKMRFVTVKSVEQQAVL